MLRGLGSSWGFSVLLKGTSVGVWRGERALDIHPSHLQSPPARDSNPRHLDYKSDSLSIRPRFPTPPPLLFDVKSVYREDWG